MTERADALRALEDEIRGAAPPTVAALDPAQVDDLAQAVAEARRRQAAEIAAAGDQALSHIPRLLRVAIRKVVG
jgi:hypothetical protein